MEDIVKTDEGYNSKHLGHSNLLDMFSLSRSLNLDALGKSLRDDECMTLNKNDSKTRKDFPTIVLRP